MSISEDGLAYEFLSKKEKKAYFKKPYNKAVNLLLLFSSAEIIAFGFIYLALSSPYGWIVPLVLIICSITKSIFYRLVIKNFNKIGQKNFWERLNINLSISPQGWICQICIFILPFINVFMMIIFAGTQNSPLAYLGVIASCCCWFINVASYLKIQKWPK